MSIGSFAVGSMYVAGGIGGSAYVLDLTANNANGEVFGALMAQAGGTGRMVQFDGVTNYIHADAVIGTGNITIECFAEQKTLGVDSPMVTLDPVGGTGWRILWRAGNNFGVRDDPGTAFGASGTPANGIHHVAMTYDGTTVSGYVDGVLTLGPTAHTYAGANNGLDIARCRLVNTWLNGRISQVAVYPSALSAARIAAHYAARGDAPSYQSAVLADAPVAYYPMDESLMAVSSQDTWTVRSLRVDINNVNLIDSFREDSLEIDDTNGEQVSASFTIVNSPINPKAGDICKIVYYDQVLFEGTIERVKRTTNNTQTARMFECQAIDWSRILVRNKIIRNFSNFSVRNIIQSLLDNELLGEGLSIGFLDVDLNVPLLDARGVSALDLLRDLAGATGQTFWLGFDKTINMQASTNSAAPILLDLTTVEDADITVDRDQYRNVQIVQVTGTPNSASSEDANITRIEKTNADQITERAAIEGGTGRYEFYDEITHPLSNRADDCELLARTFAEISLSTYGLPQQILRCRIRGYGFRAGQFATVNIASLGVSGTWLIQRVTISADSGHNLMYMLELVLSNVQRRAYESWIKIVKAGKITIAIYTQIPHSSQLFTTPGADIFVVPAGVYVLTITATAPSGGGGGGTTWWTLGGQGQCGPALGSYGGNGGNGGKAVASVIVDPGQILTTFIGSPGAGGVGGYQGCSGFTPFPTNGTDATPTTVFLGAISIVEAYGGTKGFISPGFLNNGASGMHGSGLGGIVTVGGGAIGGVGGTAGPSSGNLPGGNGAGGANGTILVEW